MTQIKQFLTKNIKTADVEEDIKSLAKKMSNSDIGFLPILQNGNYVGVITDRDLVVKGLAKDLNKAEDIMTKDVVTGSSDLDVEDAVELMKKNNIYRLLIIDDHEIQGVVSLGDLGTKDAENLIANTVSKISKEEDNN
ncbi:CBS domain-containing protein [Staphylococcus gallinarum]|uniref:CBS domain-containing protein n=1 Tax=Staphylococcus gallinarum TaxID=1293 RepID=UPI001E5FF329|nr:CBS domain-containing protein [Staphylococcus gallinarum]MCD8787426.1 CBS domain-containing protein [Staphylococcus gallinarum]MCD8845232.1 CBS domain-containing protein [Staphylococcus gallinarum]